jgi:putative FmdB family regulatory protein
MPIYEYSCKSCGNQFEMLILGAEEAVCPSCAGKELERLLSASYSKAGATSELALRAAKKRDQRQGRERMEEQRLYELNHDNEGH